MERLLCRCVVVSEREVLLAIRCGARSVADVGRHCDAGTGCGSCHAGIEAMLAQEDRRRERAAARARAKNPDQVGLSFADEA
jgi:bacterioferritin-associated ferredoxin